MLANLIQAVSESDPYGASAGFEKLIKTGTDPWDIHLSLFSVAQRVINPPYINPHLPKMYAVIREMIPYLEPADTAKLVRLEINEYAKRPTLKALDRPGAIPSAASFSNIESAISYRDRKLTAAAMAAAYQHTEAFDFTRRLLLLGSGYLDPSLGHAVSCTAFMLLEMGARTAAEPLLPTPEGRRTLARYLIKSVCEMYQGNYDPHYLTGLGSAIWFIERCRDAPPAGPECSASVPGLFLRRRPLTRFGVISCIHAG